MKIRLFFNSIKSHDHFQLKKTDNNVFELTIGNESSCVRAFVKEHGIKLNDCLFWSFECTEEELALLIISL